MTVREAEDGGSQESPAEINKLVQPGPDDAQRSLGQIVEGALAGQVVGQVAGPLIGAARDGIVDAVQSGWHRIHPQQQPESAPLPQPDDGGFLDE